MTLDRLTTENLNLAGARLGGVLSLRDAAVSGKGQRVFNGERLEVHQEMDCRGFTAEGEVTLFGAHVGGQLLFDGATLHQGLSADGLHVDQDMFCGEGFIAEGPVSLVGVGGQLFFDGATLHQLLIAIGLQVDQNMLCCGRFVAEGEVSLIGAHVGGHLLFNGATLACEQLALDLQGARVDGHVNLLFDQRPAGTINLTDARLGGLFDSEQTWPVTLELGGCVYASVQATEDIQRTLARRGPWHLAWLRRLRPGSAPDVRRRLKWIRLSEQGGLAEMRWSLRVIQRSVRVSQSVLRRSGHPRWLYRRLPSEALRAKTTAAKYAPQPYTQLIAFYRQEGRDGDARRIAYERERRRRGQLGLPGQAWNLFLQGTVGYGYTLRTLALLGTLLLVGALVFSSFHSDGRLVSVKPEHSPFVASIYTLERLIPVVSFGLRDAFAPSGAAQWWAFAYTLPGWVLTIAVVAGLTAAVRRD